MANKYSFIIIGQNEGWKLTKCLESVYSAIVNRSPDAFEVLYVDSQSTDDSLERVKNFPGLKIISITGAYNAAIARNIGVMESKGKLLFFLDGDMQLIPEFIDEAIKLNNKGLKFISGQIEEQFYDERWIPINIKMVFSKNKLNTYNLTNGGAFVIERSLWFSVGGMRTKYEKSQDIDLNYRLIRKGTKIFRSKMIYVIHHTIQYHYNPSFRNERLNFRKYLFKGLLLRDHLLNHKILSRVIRINYTLILLSLSILLAIIFETPVFAILYFMAILARSISQYSKFKEVVRTNYFSFLLKIFYQDIVCLLGFLFFYPRNYSLSYETIT